MQGLQIGFGSRGPRLSLQLFASFCQAQRLRRILRGVVGLQEGQGLRAGIGATDPIIVTGQTLVRDGEAVSVQAKGEGASPAAR